MGSKAKIELFGAQWAVIPGFDRYYASKDGKVLSLAGKYPRIMKKMQNKSGHEYVYVYRDNRQHKMFIHRAVLSAWEGVDAENPFCLHADDNPKNNRLENLRWGTAKDNAADRRKNTGYPVGESAHGAKLTESSVIEIRQRYSHGERSRELANEYNVSRNAITEIVSGKTWSHLPTIEVIIPPSCRRLTPISSEQKERGKEALARYAETIKKPRVLVECACGCGEKLVTPDSKGRDRTFIQGHNNRGKHWRWKLNGASN